MDKPVNRPDMGTLPPDQYNRILQQTSKYFLNKKVRLKDGTIGTALGVDPRPMDGVPTSPGVDGNWVLVRVPRVAAPGRDPFKNVYVMPDDLELLVPSKENGTPSPREKQPDIKGAKPNDIQS